MFFFCEKKTLSLKFKRLAKLFLLRKLSSTRWCQYFFDILNRPNHFISALIGLNWEITSPDWLRFYFANKTLLDASIFFFILFLLFPLNFRSINFRDLSLLVTNNSIGCKFQVAVWLLTCSHEVITAHAHTRVKLIMWIII